MSTVTIPATCQCGSIGRTDLRQCPDHFKIWRGDVRLTSVGRIVATSFPLDPTIPPEKLENARERGSEVDQLFAEYVRGTLFKIPARMRRDSVDLFLKAKGWFDQQDFKTVEVQVLLGGEDHGGVLDFRFDGVPYDLKCTYKVENSARLQVAGYSALSGIMIGKIIHVTERFATAKVLQLDQQDMDDWRVSLAHWRMVQRRKPSNLSSDYPLHHP